jgi:hypothetical protein
MLGRPVVRRARRQYVESGQAQDAAGDEGEGDDDPAPTQALEPPSIDQETRRDAKGDGIGQAVELDPKVALRARQARHATVETVHDHADDDEPGGDGQLGGGLGTGDDEHGIERREHTREREEIGENVLGLPKVHCNTIHRCAGSIADSPVSNARHMPPFSAFSSVSM